MSVAIAPGNSVNSVSDRTLPVTEPDRWAYFGSRFLAYLILADLDIGVQRDE